MGVLDDQGKSEKEHAYLDIFVRIEGRQSLELGAHIPPMDSSFSKILGDKPTWTADFAETSPAGPAPRDRSVSDLKQEIYWCTYNGDGPSHGLDSEDAGASFWRSS
jgi:hypothetical protein